MRCKFICESITDSGKAGKTALLSPVALNPDESSRYVSVTMLGRFEIKLTNEKALFEVGKYYYFDITGA